MKTASKMKMISKMKTATAKLTPNQKSYQLSKPQIEFDVMEEMYAASCMRTCAEKTTF